MNPLIAISAIAEGLTLLERLLDIARRANAGQPVTLAELDKAKADREAAVKRWAEAGETPA